MPSKTDWLEYELALCVRGEVRRFGGVQWSYDDYMRLEVAVDASDAVIAHKAGREACRAMQDRSGGSERWRVEGSRCRETDRGRQYILMFRVSGWSGADRDGFLRREDR